MGFPGESDEDAAEVERFVASTDLDWVGVFQYSREPGTRSYDLPAQIPASVARARAESVSTRAEETMARRADALLGAELEVLVERFDIDESRWMGRSHREAPEIDGDIRLEPGDGLSVGRYVRARVTGSSGTDLSARPVGASPA
jgi:ribosomal protein S12 methylthiotransferase